MPRKPDLGWIPPGQREALEPVLTGEELFRVPIAVEVAEPALPAGALTSQEVRGSTIQQLLDRIDELAGERKAPNGELFHVRIVASTAALARDNGIIPGSAWEAELHHYFPGNPVVLYGHNPFGLPIGRSVDVQLRKTRGGELWEWWLFNDVTDVSREVHAMYELGDMRAASVGFRIRAWHRPDEAELKKLQKKYPDANEFTWIADRVELLETSAVPVPADPKALVRGWTDAPAAAATALAAGDPVRVFLEGVVAASQRFADGEHFEDVVHAYDRLAQACAGGDQEACATLNQGDGGSTEDEGNSSRNAASATTDGNSAPTGAAAAPPAGDAPPVPAADEDRVERRGAIGFAVHPAGSYGKAPRSAPWSGSAEVAKMPAEAAALRVRHAYVEDGADADTKSAYKFPHHRAAANKAVVFRALAQGFARLDQAKVSDAAKNGIARHLGRHYRVDFDEEPPEREQIAAAERALATLLVERSVDQLGLVPVRDAVRWAGEHEDALQALGAGDSELALELLEEAARERLGVPPDETVSITDGRGQDEDVVEIDVGDEQELTQVLASTVTQAAAHQQRQRTGAPLPETEE